MASIRRLPSGKYQATVYLPSKKRTTRTDALKSVVTKWARDLETDIARGQWRDPRDGRITVKEWAKRWLDARVVEPDTLRTNKGAFKHHILPHWEEWPLAKIRRMDAQTWVKKMSKDGVQPPTVKRAYDLFSAMLRDAVDEGLLMDSPCVRIDLPRLSPKMPSWFTRDQVDRIQAELNDRDKAFVELMVHSGPRWGEAAACVGAERPDEVGNPIDWLRRKIRIVGALDQNGKWKEHPKTSKSRREVPVPQHVLDMLTPLLLGRPRDSWVFVANRMSPRKRDPETGKKPERLPRGAAEAQVKPTLSGANWRKYYWYPAIAAANKQVAKENQVRRKADQILPVPVYDPHDCRHTAASWLVQRGLPLYNLRDLLGHESIKTTEKYAHLAPDAHGAVEETWRKIITHEARIHLVRDVQSDR